MTVAPTISDCVQPKPIGVHRSDDSGGRASLDFKECLLSGAWCDASGGSGAHLLFWFIGYFFSWSDSFDPTAAAATTYRL